MTFLPRSEVLSFEETDRLCTAFVRLGVRKLCLTGGEPLVRRNIMSLFQSTISTVPPSMWIIRRARPGKRAVGSSWKVIVPILRDKRLRYHDPS